MPEPVTSGAAPEPPSYEDVIRENSQLRIAVETRDIIGQAKGIIRLLTRQDATFAFNALCKFSQDTNRKLSDVAVLIADCAGTGEPLPPKLRASWRRNIGTISPGGQDSSNDQDDS